ncbi:MAG TPA: hypothetical protein VGG74_35545 [Kofleriaceae bacterium]
MRSVWLVVLVGVWLTSDAVADNAVYRASVELVDMGGAPHAIVTSKLGCSAPAKCPEWTLDLGHAESVGLIGLVDLLGEPTRVRDVPGQTKLTLELPASARLPAAFVRTSQLDAADTRWERWAIVSIEGGKPKVIWRGELAMTTAKGGGFTTHDGVDLVATEPGKPLALVFVQTTVPEPTNKHPAAAIHRRFVIKDGTYQHD